MLNPPPTTPASTSTTRNPSSGRRIEDRLQITIESTFATVRLRQRLTKGPSSRAASVAMAFKLIESAQHPRRMVNAPHLAALVRAGAEFNDGKLVQRPGESAGEAHAS